MFSASDTWVSDAEAVGAAAGWTGAGAGAGGGDVTTGPLEVPGVIMTGPLGGGVTTAVPGVTVTSGVMRTGVALCMGAGAVVPIGSFIVPGVAEGAMSAGGAMFMGCAGGVVMKLV